MKRLFCLGLLTLLAAAATAQTRADDILYLNNGNVVKGVIVDQQEDRYVKIVTADGHAYRYEAGEIRAVESGDVRIDAPAAPRSRFRDPANRTRGFWAGIELSGGASVSPDYDSMFPVELAVIPGYRFSEFFSVGVGFGFRYYFRNANMRYDRKFKDVPIGSPESFGRKNIPAGMDRVLVSDDNYAWAFPVYLDLRGNFLSSKSRRVVPYWSLDAGYTINDGVFVSPTLGLRIGDRTRHHFLIGVNYLGQDADLKAPSLDSRPGLGDGHERRFIHALRLKLGYQF